MHIYLCLHVVTGNCGTTLTSGQFLSGVNREIVARIMHVFRVLLNVMHKAYV